MPRRRVPQKRTITPDPLYKSKVLAKFINLIMEDGKKSKAESIVYDALDIVKTRAKSDNPLEVFERALSHVKPVVEVKSRKVGGATYQVPNEVPPYRAAALAMRWIVDAAQKRGEKGMTLQLVGEILEAADEDSSTGGSTGKGGAIKKREDTHRMAEANKAFSHYRW